MKGENDFRFEILFIAFLTTVCTTYCYSQVGINTTEPQATLDVRGVNHNGPVTATDGILVPRVNSLANDGSQEGQLVYLIENSGSLKSGFYHWNGSSWITFSKNSSPSFTESVVEPDALIAGSGGTPVDFIFTGPRVIPDNNAIDIPFSVTGIVGNTTLVTLTVQIRHSWDMDLDFFLIDNNGKKLELSTDNGDMGDDFFTTVFTDSAPTSIVSGSAPFNGSYRPEGSLASSDAPVNRTGNIRTLAGFNGQDPNGTWTLRIGDDENILEGTLVSAKLTISGTDTPVEWVSLGEVAIEYFSDTAIIVQSTFSGDPIGNNGLITALTRSTSSISVGTSSANLPGTILNYASAAPSGAGNVWVNTTNLARDVGLTDNTTYYYQLWRKGNIETPLSSNETFTLMPIRIQE